MGTKRNNVKSDSNGDPIVVTSIRLTEKQHAALKRIAGAEQRTVSQQLRHVIERAVREDEEQAA